MQAPAYRERGIGLHLSGWLAAAQPLFVAAGWTPALLCDPAMLPLPATLSGYAQLSLVLPADFPPLAKSAPHYDLDRELRFDAVFEDFLAAQQCDLFHTTYPLAAEFFVPRRVTACRTVVSLYDTIPLRYPQMYLYDLTREQKLSFAERLAALLRAARVQTLTQASAQDVVQDIGVAAERIDVVSCGVSAAFAPLPRPEVTRRLACFGLAPGYLLAVTSGHFSKNFAGLLRAYAHLDANMRAQHPLVAVMAAAPDMQLARELNIHDQMRVLSGLSQPDLIALYNGAALLIHASLHEGFGLPVVEALRCGAPVACSNTSSLPEAGGDAVVYFDPTRPDEIAAVVAAVLADPERQTALRARGFAHAAQFTWEKVARAVLDSYRQAFARDTAAPILRSVDSPEPPLRIAYWSPVPPKPSGISDYSESLLARLRDWAAIDVFVDGYAPDHLALYDTMGLFDYRAFPVLHTHRSYDACLYQLGNSPFHAYMYPTLLAAPCPGIGVLHDGTLFHLINQMLSPQALLQEIGYSEGRGAMEQAIAQQRAGALDDYGYPLLRRAVQACAGVVTHSEFVAQRCRQARADVLLEIIPQGAEYYDDDGGRFQTCVRKALELPPDAVLFGVFGHMHPVKRIQQVLEAFLAAELPHGYLYLMGKIGVHSPPMLRELALDRPQAARVRVLIEDGYPPLERLLLAMHAVDVGISLRYPTTGETSAVVCGLAGMGKPLIVSDVGAFAELPDSFTIKVPVVDEQAALVSAMRELSGAPEVRQAMAQAARAYGRERTWEKVAQQYMTFIKRIVGAS